MTSLLVWAVFVAFAVLLGLIAHNFSLRTLRCVSAIAAVVLVSVITKHGIDLWLQEHPKSPPSELNLVNAFTDGVDSLIKDLLRPLLFGYHESPPGPIGRAVAAFLVLLGYRGLEAWAMRRQAPQLNSTALNDRKAGAPSAGASVDASGGGDSNDVNASLHDQLAHELKFRLAAIEVRAPAILPGGSRTGGLASIAETSGVSGAGMAGAVIRFVGSIWPSPRQLQLRIWVEPQAKPAGRDTGTKAQEEPGTKVTIYLENPRNGTTVATKTIVGADINEAASLVAGYVAWQVFTQDPSAPPWCHGRADGRDLSALLLARLERTRTETDEVMQASREAQIGQLWQWASTGRSAGIVRYELAQLLDLGGHHLDALRLHALSLDQYPRFYRGRYRLGMSLEMIAGPGLRFCYDDNTRQQLDEILGTLHRHPLTGSAERRLTRDRLTRRDTCEVGDLVQCVDDETRCTLSASLRLDLLTAAMQVLREVRVQLTLRHVVWATFRHRNERAVWLPYWVWLPGWGLRRRWANHDGVRVAELLVATRLKYLDLEGGKPIPADDKVLTDALKAHFTRNRWHCKGAVKIASAIADDPQIIWQVLAQDGAGPTDGPRTSVGWLHTRRSKASWQAGYNAACLYAALAKAKQKQADETLQALQEEAGKYKQVKNLLEEAKTRKQLEESRAEAVASERAVVRCLRSAIDNPRSEMERPSDWLSRDPDLFCLRGRDEGSPFDRFLTDQMRLDYPEGWFSQRDADGRDHRPALTAEEIAP